MMSFKYQLDLIFRRTLLLSKMFTKSWGDPEVLKILKYYRDNYMAKGIVMELIERDLPKMVIMKHWKKNNVTYMEGYFKSPLATYSANLFPAPNVASASWRGLFPADESARNGLIVHLAGTGDHSFFRREFGLANDLLKYGISSILLENPFYGTRRPKNQFRSSLLNVSDLFVMGAALMAECCFLLKWAADEGHSTLGLSGISMGGHMASLAATNMPTPTVLVPILSWTSAAPVFTFGVISEAINWPVLDNELRMHNYLRQLRDVVPDNVWADMLEDSNHIPSITSQAKRLMWILMEEFTNLGQYPTPVDPTLVRSVVAEADAYVLRTNMIPELTELWPGTQVQVVPKKGHVETYFSDHALFRQTIRDALKSCTKSAKQRHLPSTTRDPPKTRDVEVIG